MPAGLREDMLLSAAYALAPDLVQQSRDLPAEAAALEQLATFVLGFTPATSLAPPDALIAEIGSSLKLFGGRHTLVSRLATGLRERGFSTRVGVGPTPLSALAFARAGTEPVVALDALPGALEPLSLAAFDLPEEARTTLAAAGVRTFGQADRLPRAGLARRLGPAIIATLDRAAGRVPDPREPYQPPPQFTAKLELPAPVHDVEALGFAVHRLVQDLEGWLAARGLGVTVLSLALAHEQALVRHRDSPCTQAQFALGAPSRMSKHLMHILRERLARLMLPAPVAAIAIASESVAPLAGRNLALLPGEEGAIPDVPLLDRLRARLGDDAVHLSAPRADHRPERATSWHPATMRTSHPRPQATPCRYHRGRFGFSANRNRSQPPRSATVGAARRTGAHRIRLVGRPRRAPRLLRRAEPERRDRLDLPRSPLRHRRRRMVPARHLRLNAFRRMRG